MGAVADAAVDVTKAAGVVLKAVVPIEGCGDVMDPYGFAAGKARGTEQ